MNAENIKAAVRILRATLKTDCTNTLADELTQIAIDMLMEELE